MTSAEFGGGGTGSYTPPAGGGYNYRPAGRPSNAPVARPNNSNWGQQALPTPRPGVPYY